MDKRSAIATAGGVVASFVAGMAAVSFNWGLGAATTTAAVGATPTQAPLKPIIKHRTITVHKKAPQPKGASGTVLLPSPAASAPAPVSTTSGSHAAGESDDGERGDD